MNKELEKLQNEIDSLRSVVISLIGEDKEGHYKTSFIADILKGSTEMPDQVFTEEKSFLKKLTSV